MKWVFHGSVNAKSRYNRSAKKSKTIYLANVGTSTKLLSSKNYIIPKNLINIHGYHPDYFKLIEFCVRTQKLALKQWKLTLRLKKND